MAMFSLFLDENTAPVSPAHKNVVSAARKVANAPTQAVTSSWQRYRIRDAQQPFTLVSARIRQALALRLLKFEYGVIRFPIRMKTDYSSPHKFPQPIQCKFGLVALVY